MRIFVALGIITLSVLAIAAPPQGDAAVPTTSPDGGAPDSGAPDGGTPAADGGSSDAGITSKLTQGALAAAGIDPTATSEIIQPNNLQSFIVTARALGGVLYGAEGSTAIQFNPYMTFRGNSRQYQEIRNERTGIGQMFQDSVIALSISSGTPYTDDETAPRFSTLGAGLSVEILGNRSIFSDAYDACLTRAGKIFGLALVNSGPPPETQEELEAQSRLLAEVAEKQAQACKDLVSIDTPGVFLSVGGRWVLPTKKGESGDGVRIQRSFVGATWDYTSQSLTVAGQGRFLGERSQRNASLSYFGDLGVALRMERPRYSLSLEATQTFAHLNSVGPSSSATFALNLKYKFTTNWGMTLGAQGSGPNLWDSQVYTHPVVSASILYEDAPVFSTAQ